MHPAESGHKLGWEDLIHIHMPSALLKYMTYKYISKIVYIINIYLGSLG